MSALPDAQQALAARLIERLLTDPAFRVRFRREPAATCREAGLEGLAAELDAVPGAAMLTLDVRESRSSLAGVVLAAAMEGVGIAEFSRHVVPRLEDAAASVADVLSRVDLPAVKDALSGAGGGGGAAATAGVAVGPDGRPLGAAEAVDDPAATPTAPPAQTTPAAAEEPARVRPEDVVPRPKAVAETAPELADAEPPAQDAPAPETDPAPAPSAPAPDAGPQEPPDPGQFGQAGTGGAISPQAQAVLDNPRIALDDTGKADFAQGRMDPRLAAVLLKLAERHELSITSTSGDHPELSASGSRSNHFYGRGLDIGTVDGELVRPGSPAARELTAALADLDPTIRPSEVGSPFAIGAPGYFTDADHQDHIHVAFDDPIAADWRDPSPADAGGGDPAPPDVGDPPVAARRGTATDRFVAVADPAAGGRTRATGRFLAVGGEDAEPERDAAGAAAAAGDALTVGGAPGDYPGDDAPKELIALWMARRAEAAGLPPELPVMAALVESNLQNLDYGDASSQGYFQMLTTFWDSGKYEGFQKDPDKQIQWFIDHASPLKARFGSLPPTAKNLGTWIADTERPAEQYRGRYALRLEEARALIERGKARAGGGADAAAQAPPAGDEAATPDAGDAAAPSRRPDPAEYGLDGTGGRMTAEAKALLDNPKLHFDDVGVADLKANRIDPRVVALLTKLSEKHEITISCMCSDHSRLTAGGSVSNHAMGRGADIATIDGEIVRPGSPAARVLATELTEIEASIRPDEVGTPFQISAPGYFTDTAHQNHIHVGFKTAIDPEWTPPTGLAASSPAPAAGDAPAAPAAAQAARRGTATDRFLAVEAPAAPKGRAAEAARTGAFLAAREAPTAGEPVRAAGQAADLAGVSGAYPGDDASREQIAAWMAKLAEERGLPRELPIMAGLVESNLRNLSYGDADSVGFFQMRLSFWDRGAYAGYGDRPELQVQWFLDQAEAIKRQRLDRGLPVDDPGQYGEWIADVERPAAQYRGRYQLRLAEARELLRSADAQPAATGSAPSGAAAEVAAETAGAEAGGPRALAAVAEARKHLGTPYQWGGATPETGFDCSGLMQWAYQRAGITIPRVAEDQLRFAGGTAVDRDELREGDMVGFADAGGYVHHIGMYLGDGKFLHAPHTGDVVKVSSLDEPYYKAQFAGGMRVDDSAPAAAEAPAAPAPRAAAAAPEREPAPPARSKTDEFLAIRKQEASFHRQTALFLRAIDPETARRHAAGASPEELAAAAEREARGGAA